MRFEAMPENLGKVIDFINHSIKKINFPPDFLSEIDIAVEEIFINIAYYAYKPFSGDAIISVSIKDNVTIKFEDMGRPYNPLEQADPDLEKSAEDREIGGLGVFLVKNLMDKVEYTRQDDKNILTLTKFLQN
jgi:anti-sigma regulatory factor (Ser/Thr protein kinase)